MRGEDEGFSLSARAASFGHAFRGIALLLRGEHNAWIHALATVVVIAAGLFLGLTRLEWLAVLIVIGLVWTAEALNTAIEMLCNVVSKATHPEIGKAKDLAAAGVLFASMTAVAVAALVFGRRLLLLLA